MEQEEPEAAGHVSAKPPPHFGHFKVYQLPCPDCGADAGEYCNRDKMTRRCAFRSRIEDGEMSDEEFQLRLAMYKAAQE